MALVVGPDPWELVVFKVVAGVLADPVNIPRNSDGLPGVRAAEHMVGALLTYGVLAAVAGLAISVIVWALGGNSNNPHMAHRGKTGVLVALGAALLIGGADTLVQFFTNAGTGL